MIDPDIVDKVHQIVDRYYPHKDSYLTAMNWIREIQQYDLQGLLEWMNSGNRSDRDKLLKKQVFELVRP